MQAKFGGLAPEAHVVVEGASLEDALQREERVVAWLEAHRVGPDTVPDTTGGDALGIEGYQALTTFLPSRATETARRAALLPMRICSKILTTRSCTNTTRPRNWSRSTRPRTK